MDLNHSSPEEKLAAKGEEIIREWIRRVEIMAPSKIAELTAEYTIKSFPNSLNGHKHKEVLTIYRERKY